MTTIFWQIDSLRKLTCQIDKIHPTNDEVCGISRENLQLVSQSNLIFELTCIDS
jgi:hypothetical protein